MYPTPTYLEEYWFLLNVLCVQAMFCSHMPDCPYRDLQSCMWRVLYSYGKESTTPTSVCLSPPVKEPWFVL